MSAPASRVSGRRRWGLLTLAALLLGACSMALGLAWLLGSGSGRDFALARVLALLPPGSLHWQQAEGTIGGPLELHGVRYVHDGLEVEVERMLVDLAPVALLGRKLHVKRLEIERGHVVLPPGDEAPQPWPRRIELPEALPRLELPLSVVLDALSLRGITVAQGGAGLVDIAGLDLAGRFSDGRVAIESLRLDSDRLQLDATGGFDSARRWDTALTASVAIPGLHEQPLPARLELKGDLRDLTLVVAASLPEPARLTLHVTGGLPDPAWTLALTAPRVEPARLGGEGEALALDIAADGDLAHVNLSGRVERAGQTLLIQRSTLRYEDGVVALQPFALALDEGRLQATGQIDLRPADPALALQLEWNALRWSAPDVAAVSSSGGASVGGTLAAYTLQLDAGLQRGQQQARLTVQGEGDRAAFRIARAQLAADQGELDASGRVGWDPVLAWELQATLRDFDPSWLAPGFPGAVDARIASEGSLPASGAVVTVKLGALGGQLRGRALGGEAEAGFGPEHGTARADLRIGQSRIAGEGSWDRGVDGSLRLAPLDLSDLLPEASGTIEGNVIASGDRDAPDFVAALQGRAIEIAGIGVDAVQLDAQLRGLERGQLVLAAHEAVVAGQPFRQVRLAADGTRARHELRLQAEGEPAGLALQLQGGEQGDGWRGMLQELQVSPQERDAWQLQQPVALQFERATQRIRIDQACLQGAPPAALCVQADWGAREGSASLRLDALPLATFDPWLVEALQMPASAWGEVSAQVQIERRGDAIDGRLELRSAEGGLRLDPESPRELLVYSALQLDGVLEPALATLRGKVALARDGGIDLGIDLADPLQPEGALKGRVDARLRDLEFITLFTDQVASPVGQLEAGVDLSGTRAVPRLQGEARLQGIGMELPALGIQLQQGEFALRPQGEEGARIEGSVRSGEGAIRVAGELGAGTPAGMRLQMQVKGERFTAMDTPDIQALVSPDLTILLEDSKLTLRGEVGVPRARIDLEQLQSATTPSSDVVIVDAESGETPGIGVDAEIAVALGDDVRLNGFGLKGKLGGRLIVVDRPGRATVARGGIEVGGEYKAYGQDLRITRGRLAYASTPLDNPSLDIRAEREVDEITVGVQVRGTALAPELTLWSDPSLDQAEQLSYLVLGRPLRSASQADGAQLSQAAAAFGGNLLAQRLGARMGLDEVGVADSRALGGAALTVGKYLSPRLYVSYGVALFGSGQVVTFKYLLSRVWSVQIDSGSENRAALNYRLER